MRVLVKETGKSTDAMFVIMFVIIPESHVTHLGCSTSEVLGVLNVGLQVNGCDMQYKGFPELKEKYPEVFTGLGKLNNYQLKLHVDDSFAPVAQFPVPLPHMSKLSKAAFDSSVHCDLMFSSTHRLLFLSMHNTLTPYHMNEQLCNSGIYTFARRLQRCPCVFNELN